jgi:hypothetical protein
MKPLNLDNRPCSPISSNCVVWQGPSLGCINLCTGDTISDVVAKLAEELCTLIAQTNVTDYDLTCLGITSCGPKDFQALIQLLIDKICELEGVSPNNGNEKTTSGCPDCVVTVAPCFRVGNATNMQLVDYVQMIAQRVCAILDDIANINTQITNLDNRVTVLENAVPPSFTLPSFVVNCTLSPGVVIGGNSYPIDTILNALVNNPTNGYCALLGSTGFPADLSSAVQGACITSSTPTVSQKPTPFGTVYNGSWVNSPVTVADTITNLWITICDIYDYVSNVSIAVADTNSVDLNLTAGVITANIVDTGWEDLLGFNHYGPGLDKPQCRRIGTQIHFRGVAIVPLATPCNSTVVSPLSSTSAYNSVASCEVFSGAGGCFINSNGSIVFNNNNSAIPTTIVDTGTNFDNTYRLGTVIGNRSIDLDSTYGTTLTASFNVGITNDKKLYIAVLKDAEITSTRPAAANIGSSFLRFITANVRGNAPYTGCCAGECTGGEFVPDYIAAASDIHNAPSNANFPLVSNTKPVRWPFDCNAGDENQIGGFFVVLDGLIAYLDPCTTDKKSYTCGKVPA